MNKSTAMTKTTWQKTLAVLVFSLMLLGMIPPATLVPVASAAAEAAEAPNFNIPAGIYSEPQTVTLSTYSQGAVIRYTLDGSEPTSSSLVYTEPIPVDSVTQIRAYAEMPGGTASAKVEALYVIANIESEWSHDFSQFNPSDWQLYAGNTQPTNGTWSNSNGQYVANKTDANKAMIAALSNVSPQHFVMEADINPYSSTSNSGFVFRVTEPGAGADAMNGYFVGFAASGVLAATKMTRDGSTGKFTQIIRLDGANKVPVTPNAMNHLKVIGLGTTYYVYLNGKFHFKFTDRDHTIGTFGIRAWNTAGNVAFDNIRIQSLSSDRIAEPEPDLSSFTVDHFGSSSLGGEWSIFQEDAGKWNLTQNPGYLTIQTTATDLYQANNTLNNVFLRDAPENFEIVTSLHAPILRDHQQAGLIVMQDADNFYRLGQVWNAAKYIETGSETAAVYNRNGMTDHPGGLEVKLKIKKVGNQYTSYYWSNGSWVLAAEPVNLNLQNIQVGFYGNNNVAPAYPINVRVDYFGIKSIDPADEEEPDEPEEPEEPVEPKVISLPNTGLEAWYKLDEPPLSFFAMDSSDYNNHSYLTYGTWLPEGGVNGGALSLNGTSDRIVINGPSGTFLRNEFAEHSASLWFKANKTVAKQVLYERGGNAAGLAVQLNSNKLEAAVVSGSNQQVLSVDFTDKISWHHVLVTFDKGDFKLYLDGVLVAQKDTGIPLVPSALNGGGIGWRQEVDAFGGPASGAYFEGLIDDVRLYNTVVVPTIGVVSAESIRFNETELTLNLGQTYPLFASLLPINTTNPALVWESSDPSVVRIDSTELSKANVVANSAGTATVSVTTYDGGYRASIPITVIAPELQSVKLNPIRITLPVGVDYVMSALCEPSNVKLHNLKWSSDNTAVASVDENGKVTTLAPGRATIKVETGVRDISGTSVIIVEEEQESPPVYLMSYFRSDISQTGQKDEYLHFSYSRDGLRWYELNNNLPVVDFKRALRDPFLAQGEDGIWRLMFTASTGNTATSKGVISMLGYAESQDLINWTNFKMLDVMKAYKDRGEVVFNSWAPEWSYDPVNEEYVIYWSSTVGDFSSGNNKHYYLTTKDWINFSDAKLFFDPGKKTIDATLYPISVNEEIAGQKVRDKLGIPTDKEIPGNKIWYMFFKDETPENAGGMRNRQTWSDDGIIGTSSYQDPAHLSDYVTPLKTEGSSVFRVGDKWHMIYDYWWAGKFGLRTTSDITDPLKWSEENMDLRIPYRARHAGMSLINNRELWNLIQHYSLEASYAFNGNAQDRSSHQFDGEAIGNPAFASPTAGAGYVVLNGDGDAVKLMQDNQPFYIRTLSMWVKADGTDRSQMLYHEGNNDGGLALKIEGNKLIAGVSKAGAAKTVSTDYSDSEWHLATVVYEEGILKLYVDGVESGQLDTGFQPKQSSLNPNGEDPKSRNPELYDIEKTTSLALLGTGSENDVFGTVSSATYFKGTIGQVEIYTLPLFDQDINELYMNSKAIYENMIIERTIANASALPEKKVPYGTSYNQLDLPSEVEVTLEDGTSMMIGVIWAAGNYNGSISGTYQLDGTLMPMDGINNKNDVQARIAVTVMKSDDPTDPTNSTDPSESSPSIHTTNPSSEPKPPTAQVQEDGNVTVKLTANNGAGNVAQAMASTVDLEKAFGMAEDDVNGIRRITLVLPEVTAAGTYRIELPTSAISEEKLTRIIELQTPFGTVTLPENMLKKGEAERSPVIQISIGKADTSGFDNELRTKIGDRPVVELQLHADSKPLAWSNPETVVTVSVDYNPTSEELLDPEHIVVWYIDNQGQIQSVPNGKYNRETGKVTFSTTHFSSYAIAYVKKSFNDLDHYSWAHKQVEVLASKGIISGISEDTFAPDREITRADFLLMLVRTLDLKAKVTSNFDDVKRDDYYYEAVGIAKALGIASGVGDNTFLPKAYISRQDMMVLTARVLQKYNRMTMTESVSSLDRFDDRHEIAGYANTELSALVDAKLIAGSEGKLNPLVNTTRAEAAVFLYRIYNLH